MSGPGTSPEIEGIADLTLEHGGHSVAALRSDTSGCVFEIAGRRGLAALSGFNLKGLGAPTSGIPKRPATIPDVVGLLPRDIEIRLSGVTVGRFEPGLPPSDWSRRAGLTFGRLTVHKLALAKALLVGAFKS